MTESFHNTRTTRRALLMRALAERDGGDECFYCSTALVLPDRLEELCTFHHCVILYDHCGCGKHQPGEACSFGPWWSLPDGYEMGQIDHVLARSRGGSDDPINLVLSCPPCNSSKGARTPGEWMHA